MANAGRLAGLAATTAILGGCVTAPAPAPVVAESVVAALPAATTGESPSYVANRELYAQLRVRISYGGQAATNMNLCPREGFGVEDWKNILKGDRLTTAGFTVTAPDGQVISLEPMAVRSRGNIFGVNCNTALLEREYRSPLYALQTHASDKFEVKTSTHRRDRPDENVTDLIGRVVQLVGMTSGTTAPLAKPVADETRRILAASGPDLSSTTGSDIFLSAPTLPEAYTGTLMLGNREIPVRITVHLQNRASIFNDATALSPAAFAGLTPDLILQTRLVPPSSGVSQQTVQAFLMARQSAAYSQIRNATTMDTLQSGCGNLEQTLTEAGLTNTDQLLILWALISKNIGLDQAQREQARCLRDRQTYLDGVGVKLADPVIDLPPPPPSRASSSGEMLVAVAPSGDSDNLVRFFKLNSDHGALADTLFAYPLALQDPDSVLMPADRRPVAHPDSWAAYAVARDRPFFTNFGCYSYGGETGEWRARARIEGPDGPRDYALTLSFRTGPDGKALIHGVALAPAATTPADFGCR